MGKVSHSRIPIYLAVLLTVVFALLLYIPIHLASWDHDLCFTVADQNGDIPRGISRYTLPEIILGGLKRVNGFSLLGLAAWIIAFYPFGVAARAPTPTNRPWVWVIALLVCGSAFVFALGLDPAGYHDCDRKGVSFGLSVMPIVALAINLSVVALGSLLLRMAAIKDR